MQTSATHQLLNDIKFTSRRCEKEERMQNTNKFNHLIFMKKRKKQMQV